MTTNPTPIPEPTSPTAVVVGKRDGETVVAAVDAEINRLTGRIAELEAMVTRGMESRARLGARIAELEDAKPKPGPWLRGSELEAVMPTLKAGDVVEVEFEGRAATGVIRWSDGKSGSFADALRIIERAPEPEPGADIPNEVVEAALAAIPWASDHQLADVRATLAAAPALLAELADEVGVERSLRIQMARELLVLTRAAELPDPSAEDFGGVGKRILAALGVES